MFKFSILMAVCEKIWIEGSRKWAAGSKGPGNEQLDRPFGIGVLSKDHVVVFEPQNDRLQVFDAQGHFVRIFGVGMFGKGENNHIFVDSQRQYFGG